MAKSLKFGNVILADYVGKGDRNKHTLMNVLSGDIIVQDMPAQFGFGLYAEYLPDNEEPKELELEIKLDRKIFGKLRVDATSPKIGNPSIIAVPLIQIGVDKDLTLQISASCEGYRKTKILSKRIYKAPIPEN